VGNLLLPFFGGVPATAAIARISVGIKAGGATRMVSFVHSAALLAGALFLGGAIAHIPLAALAGVLLVTAWRMNEWHVIGYYVKRRLKGPLLVLLATMVATVALDLTQAILVGIGLSLLLFISQVSRLQIVPTTVDWDRLRAAGHAVPPEVPEMQVVYVSGTLYFGVVNQLTEALDHLPATPVVILSMRGVPMVDVSCVHAIEHLWQHQSTQGGTLLISGLQPPVRRLFERARLVETLGVDKFFWSADQAILHACREFPALTAAGQPARTVVDEGEAALNDLPLGVVPMQ
jgi:sulfate permease, SulP family